MSYVLQIKSKKDLTFRKLILNQNFRGTIFIKSDFQVRPPKIDKYGF